MTYQTPTFSDETASDDHRVRAAEEGARVRAAEQEDARIDDGEVVNTSDRVHDADRVDDLTDGVVDADLLDDTDQVHDATRVDDDQVVGDDRTVNADRADAPDLGEATDPETAAAVADREATMDEPAAVDRPVDQTLDRETALASDAALLPAGATADATDATADPTDVETSEVPSEAVEHAPGQVEAGPVGDLWPAGAGDALRERWRELQLRFVDDPQGVAAGADQLVAEAVEALTSSLQAQRAELAQWRTSRDSDTEALRVAVQRYHTFLDRVLAL
jgi:hypothetical protein